MKRFFILLTILSAPAAPLFAQQDLDDSMSPVGASATRGVYSYGNVSYYYDSNGDLVTGRKSGDTTQYYNSSGNIGSDRVSGGLVYRSSGGMLDSVAYGESAVKKNTLGDPVSKPSMVDLLVNGPSTPTPAAADSAPLGTFSGSFGGAGIYGNLYAPQASGMGVSANPISASSSFDWSLFGSSFESDIDSFIKDPSKAF